MITEQNSFWPDERQRQRVCKAAAKAEQEAKHTLTQLRQRPDWNSAYEYFLDLAEQGGNCLEKRIQLPVAALCCLQAPLELFHAAQLHAYKLSSGFYSLSNLANQGLPSLTCPFIRSLVGFTQLQAKDPYKAWIIPTTCDWVVKFPEIQAMLWPNRTAPLYWLELPHLKDQTKAQNRWLEEIMGLKKFLEQLTGCSITRKKILASINIHKQAWLTLSRLNVLKRQGQIAFIWYLLLTSTFFLDKIERWTSALQGVVSSLPTKTTVHKGIFLAGSPLFFPNFKLPLLLEQAGLNVIADDLCSSERLLPGNMPYKDHSEFGLISALAQRYHQGCLCPTFADNDRRINNILTQTKNYSIKGVIFHILKGCHPYDLESYILEQALKKHGLKFLRLETDYTNEDSRNLLTRLEAFARNLEND